jgi:archaellum component FlaC
MPNGPPQNDYSELIVYLDEKFSLIATRQELDEGFGVVNKRLDELSDNFDKLATGVDAYAKKADTYFQEMVMLSRKVDRLERWVMELADKLNMRFKA